MTSPFSGRNGRRRKPVAEINITPFTDVILVLLVIFMITTPVISQSNFKINLPEAKNGEPAKQNQIEEAVVTITDDGIVYLNRDLVTRDELKTLIQGKHEANPGLAVVIRSDKSAKFKEVIGVLDLLTELGVTKLKITVTPPEPGK